MTPGDVTQGRRRPDGTRPHELEPGDYSLEGPTVWLCSPDGRAGHVTVPAWQVTVEPDDTITVAPSIFWDRDASPPGWHGYLERGVWRQV